MLRASVRPGRCYGNEATKGGGAREAGVRGGGAIPRASRTHSLHESDKGGRGLGLETPSLFFS